MNRSYSDVSVETVKSLDLEKYKGAWYTIAYLPNGYQDDCLSSIAFYILLDGKMAIRNYCVADNKVIREIRGEIYPKKSREPGKLKVKFDGFFFNREGDYWIHDTDYTRYSLVGDGRGENFWILARTESIDIKLYRVLINRARELGYNTSLFRVGPHAILG